MTPHFFTDSGSTNVCQNKTCTIVLWTVGVLMGIAIIITGWFGLQSDDIGYNVVGIIFICISIVGLCAIFTYWILKLIERIPRRQIQSNSITKPTTLYGATEDLL